MKGYKPENTPFNTGKVLIGLSYQPPVRYWTFSRTELDLQAALLQRQRKPSTSRPGHRPDKCPGIFTRALQAFWRWA